MPNTTQTPFRLGDTLWDLWCICSVIGIWPRFIEPNLIHTTYLTLSIPGLPFDSPSLKIVQFSDLHLNPRMPDRFLAKLQKKIQAASPDILVFTGDFLCFSQLDQKKRLKEFLNTLSAPFGCYAILGNHDYEQTVSLSDAGDYDLIANDSSLITKGFKRLAFPVTPTRKVTAAAQAVREHPELCRLLLETPFELLNNRTKRLDLGKGQLNLCGVGEHMLGRCRPEEAFADFDPNYPGIILAHNPDCLPVLAHYPGDIILSGHTHGAQVNLPWMWKKFVLMENPQYTRGLFSIGTKHLYVNRGVGSVLPFRWFSTPEILVLELKPQKPNV